MMLSRVGVGRSLKANFSLKTDSALEASIESRGPKAAFQATEGGPLLSGFELGAKGAARFPVPCAILLAGNELLVSSPFGNLRLSGPGAR